MEIYATHLIIKCMQILCVKELHRGCSRVIVTDYGVNGYEEEGFPLFRDSFLVAPPFSGR